MLNKLLVQDAWWLTRPEFVVQGPHCQPGV